MATVDSVFVLDTVWIAVYLYNLLDVGPAAAMGPIPAVQCERYLDRHLF